MSVIHRLKTSFNRAATGYENHARLQHRVARRVAAQYLANMPENTTPNMLDLGAGTGFVQQYTDPQGQMDWISVDLAQNMLEQCRGKRVCADMCALPFQSGIFDGVVSSLAVQWAPDLRVVFAELARILAPHGCAVLSFPIAGSFSGLPNKMAAQIANQFVSAEQVKADAVNYFSQIDIQIQRDVVYYLDMRRLLVDLRGIGSIRQQQDQIGLASPLKHVVKQIATRRYAIALDYQIATCTLRG